jgi:predicted peroxiredoxin
MRARGVDSPSVNEEVPMKVLYLATTGAGDPTKASIPLHIAANGSVEAEQECAVVLAGDATELVSRETTQRVEGVGVPPARELFQKLVDNQVPVFV